MLKLISRLSLLFTTSYACAVPSQDLQTLAGDNNQFGVTLYSQLNDDSNVLFSPYSIFSCLSMVYEGARGETATGMEDTLHISLSREKLPMAASQMMKQLSASAAPDSKAFQLNIANALWLDQDTFILSDFRHTIQDEYDAKMEILNFSIPSVSTETINEWVSNETEGKIPHLLEDGDITGDTRLVLTNAIYFKGTWTKPFDPKTTQEGMFYPKPREATKVNMMDQTQRFPYFENETLQVLSLPFISKSGGGQIACLLVLPKKPEQMAAIEKSLSSTLFEEWMNQLAVKKIHIKMPKFCMDQRFDLNDTLSTLGMSLALSKQADFSGIDGMHDLYVSKVVHQAYFSLDESGVTAAAATAAGMNMTTALEPQAPPIPFIADHPFLFMIVELNTKTVLFMGKYQNPNDAQCN